ncbi:MAG: nucleoside triphosphate pyrophosphohydrolase [Chloroflexi bacterium]|nr:nucleoside triphosphate pyrophosphohydrolase [Chloroflexota bacterium]
MTQSSTDREGTFEALLEIVERLRDHDGCPWDRAQTHASLRQHLLEECYEALEAIDSRDAPALAEELGDLLVHIAFHADIASRSSEWTARELVSRTSAKLVRRHPHVFGDAPRLGTAADVLGQWEALKRAERGPKGIVASVPRALPALAYAAALQRKAEAAGVKWRHPQGARHAIEKSRLDEVMAAPEGEGREALAGDLLFDAVAALKGAGVDPETALRSSTFRFRRRLESLEEAAGDMPVADLPEAERARLWKETGRDS